ncbi:hypothetical protein HQK30_04045 [Aeromonas hydrophila]|nr:hypothetical protein HQK30_04045 [Aeromonas hydrophila]
MSTADSRRKTLHYRHAVMLPAQDQLVTLTLQERLESVVNRHLTTVTDRCYYPEAQDDDTEELSPSKNSHFTFSYCDTIGGMLCAEIVYVEPGRSIPIISKEDYDKDALEYEALNFTGDGKREFLESVAFIGVVKNHIIVLQSKSIRLKDIEDYINALLQKTHNIPDESFIVLQANNQTIDNYTLKNKQVKNVKITLPLSITHDFSSREAAFDVLGVLLGQNRIDELRYLQGSNQGRSLDLDISIGYKYSTDQDNQQFLKHITQGLIDNRDESLTIELKGAGRLIGEQMQVKTDAYFIYSKSIIVRDHVFERMIEWLIELLEQGVINP